MLDIKHHTTILDIACLGTMLRNELLPLLGMEETVKCSQLTKLFNSVIDYNSNLDEDETSEYLNKVKPAD